MSVCPNLNREVVSLNSISWASRGPQVLVHFRYNIAVRLFIISKFHRSTIVLFTIGNVSSDPMLESHPI